VWNLHCLCYVDNGLTNEWTQPTFSPCFLKTILIMSPHLCLGRVFPHSISSPFYPSHWWRVQNDDFHSVLFSILFNIRILFTVLWHWFIRIKVHLSSLDAQCHCICRCHRTVHLFIWSSRIHFLIALEISMFEQSCSEKTFLHFSKLSNTIFSKLSMICSC
jgi:hypothetical protein